MNTLTTLSFNLLSGQIKNITFNLICPNIDKPTIQYDFFKKNYNISNIIKQNDIVSQTRNLYNIFNSLYNIFKIDNPFLLIEEINLIFNKNDISYCIKYIYYDESYKLYDFEINNYNIIFQNIKKFKYYLNIYSNNTTYFIKLCNIKTIKDLIMRIWNNKICNDYTDYKITISDYNNNTIYYTAYLIIQEYTFYNRYCEEEDAIICNITDFKNYTNLQEDLTSIEDFIDTVIFKVNITILGPNYDEDNVDDIDNTKSVDNEDDIDNTKSDDNEDDIDNIKSVDNEDDIDNTKSVDNEDDIDNTKSVDNVIN
jgi:hypothetical protein